MSRSRKWLTHPLPLIVGVVLAALPAAAPAAAPASGNGWVGRVSGTQAFVGLVLRGDAVTAYVCDGRRVGRWYTGRLLGGRATLRDSQGHRLAVRVAGGSASGSVDLPGRRGATFVARRARGNAGLFRRQKARAGTGIRSGGQTVTGWIRLNDGRVKGLAASRPVRARLFPPRTTVLFSVASSTTTTGAPESGPRTDERLVALSGPCDPVPRPATDGVARPKPFTPGPTCGLPTAGMSIGVRRTKVRLRLRQPGFNLSSAAVERLKADLPRIFAREQVRVLGVTGLPNLPPTLPTTEQRRRLDLIAKNIVRDAKLTAAADAYRRAPTAAQAAAYRAFAGKYVDPTFGLIDRPEVAVREFTPVTNSATSEQTLPGPWAVFEFEELEGPDSEVTPTEQIGVLGDALTFGNLARAGFHSSAGVNSYAVLDIDVPPGAREVEIETVAHRNPQLETRNSCLAGSAWARTGMSIMLHAIDPDGTFHIFDGAPVDGVYFNEEFSQKHGLPIGICPTAPPVPEPPFFESLEEFQTLRISNPPAAGGHYLLTIGSDAFASTLSDGQAWADHYVGIEKVIVRSRF